MGRLTLWILIAGALAALVSVTVAAARAPVAPELRSLVPKLKQSDVPVLLPGYFPYARAKGRNLRAAASSERTGWGVSLFYGAACGGANACTVGFLEGRLGGTPGGFAKRVRLVRGITATYKPTTCGASCSPAEIDWRQGANVYRYQLQVNARGKAAEQAAMIRMANSAITAGPR